MIQIPVTNQPNQSFQVSIPIGERNVTVGFYISWNRISDCWHMSLFDVANDVAFVEGLAMVPGASPAQDLLQQLQYLQIGQAYVTPITSFAGERPGLEDWGVNYVLLWGTEIE